MTELCLNMTTPKLRKVNVDDENFKLLVENEVDSNRLLEYVKDTQKIPYASKKDVRNAVERFKKNMSTPSIEEIISKFVAKGHEAIIKVDEITMQK